jgi:predicted phage tail protein
MLLNELLKEHRKVQEQADAITELKGEIANFKAIVKDQTTQIQKVTAQVESTEAAVRIAVNQH